MPTKVTIVLGVIGADCHAVANKILNHTFTEAGFNVVNLGVMVSQAEFIEAATRRLRETLAKEDPDRRYPLAADYKVPYPQSKRQGSVGDEGNGYGYNGVNWNFR